MPEKEPGPEKAATLVEAWALADTQEEVADLFAGGLAALVLGLTTTLAPCALAANLSALTFLLGWVGDRRTSLVAGLALASGALVSASAVASLVASLAIPAFVAVIRQAAPMLVCPLLIVVGMVHAGLLGALPLPIHGGLTRRHLDRPGAGVGAGFVLGLLLPLVLCPSAAAFFLAAVVPLAVGHGSRVVQPLLYGLGVAMPLVVISIAVRAGVGIASVRPEVAAQVAERAGWVLIAAGVAWAVVRVWL